MSGPTLGYWSIRGLAQPVRLLLGYTKTDFEDKLYECGDAPDYNKSCWLDVKDTLGLDFPNLPYLIDGDIKVTQSNAVIRYLGRKLHMNGDTEKEKVIVDMMENELMDFRNGFIRFCYGTKPNVVKEATKTYVDGIKSKSLKSYEKFMTNKNYLAGAKLTYVDFILYELLSQHIVVQSDILGDFPNLQAYIKRIEELPDMASFLKSDKCFKGPLNNKIATVK